MADDIFETGDLDVDFSGLDRNLAEEDADNLLYQFQNSCLLIELICTLAIMEQNLYDAAVDVLEFRTLSKAEGKNLDIIGRIVGQDRVLLNAALIEWFGWDAESNGELGGWDQSPWWVDGAAVFGDLPADDPEYRTLILAKIFKNHVKVGSVPEILRFVKLLTGFDISIYISNPMDITLVVPEAMPFNSITTIVSVLDDDAADRKYLIPMPATGRIVGYMKKLDNGFIFDRVGHGWDQANFSVEVPL